MKKLSSFLVFFIGGSLLLFLSTLSGCGKMIYYIIKDINVDVMQFSAPDNPNPSGVDEGGTADYSRYFVQVRFDISKLESMAARLLPVTSVYAFKPGPSTYQNVEGRVQDIRIITLRDYNADFPVGSDMADACNFADPYLALQQGAVVSKQDFIKNLEETQNVDDAMASYIACSFKTPTPATAGLQQFVVEISMASNTLLRDTTVLFTLNP